MVRALFAEAQGGRDERGCVCHCLPLPGIVCGDARHYSRIKEEQLPSNHKSVRFFKYKYRSSAAEMTSVMYSRHNEASLCMYVDCGSVGIGPYSIHKLVFEVS